MNYTVKPGDSLWLIARNQLHDANRWPEIAKANGIHAPYVIFAGQTLRLPAAPNGSSVARPPVFGPPAPVAPNSAPGQNPALMLGRAMFFVVVRQLDASGKLVRKVMLLPETDISAMVVNRPDLFGFHPRQPNSPVTPGEHALGNTMSKYLSASTKPKGAPNFPGEAWYIDIAKAERAGVKIVSTEEIIRDLDRLAKLDPTLAARIAKLKSVIDSVEGEVLMQGSVPKGAVMTAEQATREIALLRGIGKGARILGAVGVVLTVYDLGKAGVQSYEQRSIKPIAKETIRQVGGWGMAKAGFELGLVGGAAVGVETGPGLLVTGLAGGLILGVAGYFGADWVANRVIK